MIEAIPVECPYEWKAAIFNRLASVIHGEICPCTGGQGLPLTVTLFLDCLALPRPCPLCNSPAEKLKDERYQLYSEKDVASSGVGASVPS
jgi:hypothetical protein